MRYVRVGVSAIVVMMFLLCGSESYALDVYTRYSGAGSGLAPACDAGDVCLFALVNSTWDDPYDLSFNSHITGCHFADNGSVPMRVCADGLLSSVLRDGDGCEGNEYGIISFTDNTTSGGHAQIYGGQSYYQYHVCVEPRVSCVLRVGGCDASEVCVAGLTDRTNAHVSDCNAFQNPYDFRYFLCCADNYFMCERKTDGETEYWWDGSDWATSAPDGCSCEFDSQCVGSDSRCINYVCVPIQEVVIGSLDDVYDLYIGQRESLFFSLTSQMDEDVELYISGVNARDVEEFMPFAWLSSHKFDEYRYNLPLELKSGETKYFEFVVEPAPKSGVVPFELVFKVVSNTTGLVSQKTVGFLVTQEYDSNVSFMDRADVSGIGFVGMFFVLVIGLIIFKRSFL